MGKIPEYKKLLVIMAVGLIAIVCLVFLFSNAGKIKAKDYKIVDKNYKVGSVYNRTIGEMSNIEYILDDLLANYTFYLVV